LNSFFKIFHDRSSHYYQNKPLDQIDFKAKEALNSSSVRLNRKNAKKIIKFGGFFSHYSFRFASVPIKSQDNDIKYSEVAKLANKFLCVTASETDIATHV
jgi:hypothetical protein